MSDQTQTTTLAARLLERAAPKRADFEDLVIVSNDQDGATASLVALDRATAWGTPSRAANASSSSAIGTPSPSDNCTFRRRLFLESAFFNASSRLMRPARYRSNRAESNVFMPWFSDFSITSLISSRWIAIT